MPTPSDCHRRRAMLRTLPALGLAWIPMAASMLASAQPKPRVARVGLLSLYPAPTGPDAAEERGLREGLRENGYVEGKNIVIERRYADNRPDRLVAMANELVQMNVDVLLTGGQPAREAARRATSTIPILTVSGSDPVREGWAQSLSRPGGNVTGLTFTFPELGPKRLELLKEGFPSVVRVAVLIDPIEVVDAVDVLRETEAGAKRLGLQLQVIKVHGPNELDAAFAMARQQHAQAMFPIAMLPHRERVASMTMRDRLLTIGESQQEAAAGYSIAYGADLDDLVRRSMTQMDKILKGARVGDVPIERPTKFRLAVNVKSTKALGMTVANSLLLRADEVIE
jgi:putative tryptophan/tyrosine transport system substrate-binding protein